MIQKIVLPENFNFDHLVAVYLLRTYGQERYPGISTAQLVFLPEDLKPTAKKIAQWQKTAYFVGFQGRGSASLKAVRELAIEKKEELRRLLQYLREYLELGKHRDYGELPYLVEQYQKIKKPEAAFATLLEQIEALQSQETAWLAEVAQEFNKSCSIFKVKRKKSKVKVIVCLTDHPQMEEYLVARRPAAGVIKDSQGYVRILFNPRLRLRIDEFAAGLRLLELIGRGEDVTFINRKKMHKPGLLPEDNTWDFQSKRWRISNPPSGEKTQLPLEQIVDFLKFWLSSEYDPRCCQKSRCLYFPLGLDKCKKKYS